MVYSDKKFIADKIREYRKKRNLTQLQLAEKVNIGVKQISRIVVGDFYPSIQTFLKIAEVLHIDLSAFVDLPDDEVNKTRAKLTNIINAASDEELNFYDRLITFADDEIVELKKNLILRKIV